MTKLPAAAAAPALFLALSLAGCSSEPESPDPSPSVPASAAAEAPVTAAGGSAAPAGAPLLALEGLGDLRIGAAVPAGSRWKADEVQASDTCLTYASPDYPGVYAIVEDGKVGRISIVDASPVRLVEGIGFAAAEKAVQAAFPGFREEPHAYSEPPAKYLTAPGAGGGGPALRFEIDAERKVSGIHVGTMPVLGYVEACA
jgi:hypothetical protein